MKEIDDTTQFLSQLKLISKKLANSVSGGEMPASFAAFQLLTAYFSAKDLPKNDVQATYPVLGWREDMVEIPAAILRPIAEGWLAYYEQGGRKSLEACLGISATTRGGSPLVKKERTKVKDKRLSNLVVADYIASRMEGTQVSLEAAYEGVAEKESCSAAAVERAYKRFGRDTIARLEETGTLVDWRKPSSG